MIYNAITIIVVVIVVVIVLPVLGQTSLCSFAVALVFRVLKTREGKEEGSVNFLQRVGGREGEERV